MSAPDTREARAAIRARAAQVVVKVREHDDGVCACASLQACDVAVADAIEVALLAVAAEATAAERARIAGWVRIQREDDTGRPRVQVFVEEGADHGE